MKVLLFLCVLLVGQCYCASWWRSQFGSEETNEEQSYCKGYECPDYDVVEQFNGYELRRYNSTVWVTTKAPVMAEEFWNDRQFDSTMFFKLYRYIRGENDRSITMDMTVPVIKTHMKDSVDMGFLLPSKYSQHPPNPTEANVSIYRQQGGHQGVYVRTFSGFPYGFFGFRNYFKYESRNLISFLKRDNHSVETSIFYTAGYDSPWKFFNRRNEVWMIKN